MVKGADYPIDKVAFTGRVIAEVEKVRDTAAQTMPWLAKRNIPRYLNTLTMLREQIAQQHAVPEPIPV